MVKKMHLDLVATDSAENVRDERGGWNVFFLFNKGDIEYKIIHKISYFGEER